MHAQHCLMGITIVYDPLERVVTLDDKGGLNVWAVGRDAGGAAEALQSFEVSLATPYRIGALAACFEDGKYLALLADRVYFFNNVRYVTSAGCPVPGGLLVTRTGGEDGLGCVLTIFPRSLRVARLSSGAVERSLQLGDGDREGIAPHDYLTAAAMGA